MSESVEDVSALQKQNCIFCKIIKGEIPSKIVHEDDFCTAILDINPANEGHIILLPKEHYQIMPQVPKETLAHLAVISKKLSKAILISTFGKSSSIFIANGAVAGQKAPHFMIHLIPRKSEKEFLVIPSKPATPSDLEQVKNIITKKIEAVTGIKVSTKKIEAPEVIHKQKDTLVMNGNVNVQEKVIIEEKLNHPRKILKSGIKKEKGYLYYVDDEGDVARVPMNRGKKKKEKSEKIKDIEDKNLEKKNDKISEVDDENFTEEDSNEGHETTTLDDISRMLLGERK